MNLSYLLSLYVNAYLNRCTYCNQCKKDCIKEAAAYQVKKLIKFNKRGLGTPKPSEIFVVKVER